MKRLWTLTQSYGRDVPRSILAAHRTWPGIDRQWRIIAEDIDTLALMRWASEAERWANAS